jgi:steroid 5-alpha reductase family enzyme
LVIGGQVGLLLHKHIRKIFSVFVLGMIALFAIRLSADAWSSVNWLMMLTAAISCLLVFTSFVFVFNFSYALACIFNGLIIMLMLPSVSSMLLGGAMFIYGLRLFLFTWYRVRSESYQVRVKVIAEEDARLPGFVKFALWVQCTFMYTFHLFAVYLAAGAAAPSFSVYAATAIILFGTLIEGTADRQKQQAKARAPGELVTSGLFSRWRHPNYAGEVLVQIGLILAGVGAVSAGWGNYAAATIAPVYVILLMVSECTRVDLSQAERFGENESYRQYVERSGSLLPGL